jgi:organic hydroperoxide reductase OsmC/OhrA
MIKYPISFFANASSDSGIQSIWNVESQKIGFQCAIPPEFEGPGGALSPEDLFAQALTNCFIATFKVFAEKSKLRFRDLSVKTELVADLDEKKRPIMKKCVLNVVIGGCESPDRIRTIAEKAFSSGFIINSVKTDTRIEILLEE